jgi:hypothetical protein
MNTDRIILDAGVAIGTILRHTAAEYREAAEVADLSPAYREHLLMLAEWRERLAGQ